MSKRFNFRLMQPEDNPAVARVIREVMTEFGAVGEGYSIMDPEVDQMYESYNNERSRFYVITEGERILGCGGVGPLVDADPGICELKKMYFYPELRGKGWGRKMVDKCLKVAKELGYRQCYLETVERMEAANKLYQKTGFHPLTGPMGNTGHSSCQSFYIKDL